MLHARKMSMIKTYGDRLRTRRILDLYQAKEANYASYFTGEGEQQQPQLQEEDEEAEEMAGEGLPVVEGEDQQQGEQQGEEFSVADYIQLLSHQEREAFKQDNPQLPPLFFMTKAEKKRYFQQLNKTFHTTIAKMPQRKSKTKKILKFRPEFEVKHFDERQKVVALGKVKKVSETYQQKIHFG